MGAVASLFERSSKEPGSADPCEVMRDILYLRACLKNLHRQSSAAMGRFRIRHRPIGPCRGNGCSCPNPDFTPAPEIALNGSLERYGPNSSNGISVSSARGVGKAAALM